MYSSVSSLKSVPFGIYCLISLLVFSMAPFCQEAYEPVKYTVFSALQKSYGDHGIPIHCPSLSCAHPSCKAKEALPLSLPPLEDFYFGKSLHKQVIPASLIQCQDGALLSFPHYQIHFPISEPRAVCLCRAIVYTHSARDITHLCFMGDSLMSAIFHAVTAMLAQLSTRIRAYSGIYCLMGNPYSFQ